MGLENLDDVQTREQQERREARKQIESRDAGKVLENVARLASEKGLVSNVNISEFTKSLSEVQNQIGLGKMEVKNA